MNIDWGKRLKSFGMAAGAMILTAVIGVVVSPDFQALVASYGVPASMVAAIALVISEAWKEWVNQAKIAKIARNEGRSKASILTSMESRAKLY